ncbi:hypothetical protein BD770DRAFT_477587 [Pilaira anomala]|nr:hypothetical protein BD770DRAFT_477587 [Pilaira anomala]
MKLCIKILNVVKSKILNPEIKMGLLKPPFTNINRKGRKAKTGVKGSNDRLTIYLYIQVEKNKHEEKAETKIDPVQVEQYESIQIYNDRKNDKVFKMGGDGNCGFYGVRFGLYRDQNRWPESFLIQEVVSRNCFHVKTLALCLGLEVKRYRLRFSKSIVELVLLFYKASATVDMFVLINLLVG